MGKVLAAITPELQEWIKGQHVFFVSSAPLSPDGHVNCSPKGGDAFRILGPLEVVYQDYTGSGAETVAHIRENKRLVIMFCAFSGSPKIVRLHGSGSVIRSEDPRFAEMAAHFPAHPGTRAFIHLAVTRVSDSCGYSVPFFDYREHRDTLDKWWEAKGADEIIVYREQKNQRSIDGLPAFVEEMSFQPSDFG